MSYLGFARMMTHYCANLKHPQILEIGVDRGQTTLPLYHNLMMLNRPFNYVALDIKMDACLYEQLKIFDGFKPLTTQVLSDPTGWNMHYFVENSLTALPALVESGWKFDLVLIDGDHNYPTVAQELSYLNDITFPSSLVIVDDYNGRHSDVDTFYADYESHEGVDKFMKLKSVEGKAGVNQAVDDWALTNKDWTLANEMPMLEPAILLAPGMKQITWTGLDKLHKADWGFRFSDFERLLQKE